MLSMTSDFRAFAIAPKFIIPAGGVVSAAAIAALAPKIGDRKTPYLYACFGDVLIAGGGTITHAIPVSGGQTTANTFTLRSGSLIPLEKGQAIDITGSTNPVMVLLFAT